MIKAEVRRTRKRKAVQLAVCDQYGHCYVDGEIRDPVDRRRKLRPALAFDNHIIRYCEHCGIARAFPEAE